MSVGRFFAVLSLSLFLLSPLLPEPALAFSLAPAQPESALFYPNEVEVTVSEELSPESLPFGGKGFVITLPAAAVADSFLLSLDGAPAGGWFWLNTEQRQALLEAHGKKYTPYKALLPENESDPERKALLQELLDLAEQASRLKGESAATEARLALLRKTLENHGKTFAPKDGETPLSRADEAAKLDEAYSRLYPLLYPEAERQRKALAEAEQRQAEAQRKVFLYDRRVGVNFLVVPASGSGSSKLRYSYLLPARTQLIYRLNAMPDRGELYIGQDASLTQNSGFAWEKVEVSVSTIRRDNHLAPDPVRPWVAALSDKPRPSPLAKAPASKPSSAGIVQYVDSLNTGATDQPQPDDYSARQRVRAQQDFADPAQLEEVKTFDVGDTALGAQEFATFRLWNLGPQRIDNDSLLRLALEERSVPASFLYTLRPSLNPKGFLTASLDLEKALELPPGAAQMAVDGAVMGRRHFSFNGRKGDIYFGSDPRVTAIMSDMQRSGGEQGFFSKDQTKVRHWEILVSNARQRPVQVLLEDAAPDARDTGISVKNVSSPKPEAVVLEPEQGGAKIWRWAFTLEPGSAKKIDHRVEISAPAGGGKELQSDRDALAGQ